MIRLRTFFAAVLLVLWTLPAFALTTTLTAETTFLLVSTNGTHTATLYDPSKIPGHVVTIKNDTTQAGTTTVATAAGNLDGSSTIALTGVGAFVTVRAAAGNWKITASSVTVGGGVPSSRTLTAGAGMVGGGDFTANRTVDVVAADSTITVNADSIQVGTVPVAQVSGAVTTARTITTTAPLQGGGALSSNLTLTLDAATTTALGSIKLAQDLAGTGALPVVGRLTGVSNTVGIPANTILQYDSSGPSIGTRDSGLGLNLRVATTNNSIALLDGSTLFGFFNYNSGNPFYQSYGLPFLLMTTGANDLRLAATGTGTLHHDGLVTDFRSASGATTRGSWDAATLTLNTPFLTFGTAATNPTISQSDPTNQIGGIAGWFAQGGNGTNKAGGLIQLWGGKPTGSADSGYVTIGTQNAAGTTFPMVQAMTISGQHVVAIGKESVLTTSDYSSTVGDRTLYLADATGIGTGVMPANGTVVYSFAGSPTWKGSNGGKTVSWTSNTSDTATGGLDVLPAAPAKFLSVTVDGTTYKIPLYSP